MKKRMLVAKLILISIFALIHHAVCLAAVFNVTSPAEFQAALTSASSNGQTDTINVAAGTYNLTNTLVYEFKPAGGEQYPLLINGPAAGTAILDGSAIPADDPYTNIMRFHYFSESPGAASDENCTISINRLTFQNGTADDGGGIYFFSFYADLLIDRSTFDNNRTTTQSYGGGGLYLSSSNDASITNSSFTNNSTEYNGGAFRIDSAMSFNLLNNTFTGNSAEYNEGGGAVIEGVRTVVVNHNHFENNSGNYGGGLYLSRGILSIGESIEVSHNTFLNNEGYNGGGAYIEARFNAATILDNTFTDNHDADVAGGSGGGLFLYANKNVTVDSNRFHNNETSSGGGLYAAVHNNATIKLVNNVFSSNRCNETLINAGGGAVVTLSYGTATLTNNSFVGNEVLLGDYPQYPHRGGGLYVSGSLYDGPGTLNLYNNLFWGNSVPPDPLHEGDDIYIYDDGVYNAAITIRNNYYSDYGITTAGSPIFGDNHISAADPGLKDPLNYDVHLKSGSICIDAGSDTAPGLPALDFDGDNRKIDTHVDIGADEFIAPVIVPGDVNGDGKVDTIDLIIVLQILSGISPLEFYLAADLNGDGKFDMEDVLILMDTLGI